MEIQHENLSPFHEGPNKNKPDQHIHSVVNWGNAPAYKLSKLFTKKVNQLVPLPHSFNTKNTQDLLNDRENTPILPHHNLASLDVTNLYTNIPVKETKTIFTNILTNSLIAPKHNRNYSVGMTSSLNFLSCYL
jgi:hypothetical protein